MAEGRGKRYSEGDAIEVFLQMKTAMMKVLIMDMN